MPLPTTVVGSYPKPANLNIPDWFKIPQHIYSPSLYSKFHDDHGSGELEKEIKEATSQVLNEQIELGIDVVTDGEIKRENYIFYFCRRLDGFDFTNLIQKAYRNGALEARLPRIVGKIARSTSCDLWAALEWKETQEMSSVPVKYTVPGPMTIMGSTHNEFYTDDKELGGDLVKVINDQIKGLADAGCRHIQLDEPVMVRNPDVALDFGIDHAARCFEGVGPEVMKVIHLCCGYPTHLDQADFMKANRSSYFQLADQLDNAGFDAISIEDAHQHNDLALLGHFKKSKVIIGVVAVANTRVETVEGIRNRLIDALKYIPAERLMVAPDCGLGFLPPDILKQKITNMVTAAKSLP